MSERCPGHRGGCAAARGPAEERVLVLAPTERDAELSRAILAEAGIDAVVCPDLSCLCRELVAGAGAAVLTGEAVLADAERCLEAVVRDQPPWSDFPLVVLTDGGADSPVAGLALETLGNVTLLDRPVRVSTLISTVQSALRSRRKQYEVRDHLAERAKVAEVLREADRRKDEFLAMLGHELRNPLTPVQNAVHILRIPGVSAASAERARAMIERQVAHLVRLVDDLLDVSRITRGKVELRKETVDAAAVAARSADVVRPFLGQRGHRLDVDWPPEALPVVADPARLEQVVTNLLTNAGKYTPPGGHIRLAVGREGSEAVIRVSDNGIGIRPEVMPRLFEWFMQSDRVPGRVSEGLGLGLALVKLLVELHGGTVSAASEGPGLGSEFTVRLSLAPAESPPPDPASTADAPARAAERPLRVLVCDDNEDAAESLATLLELHGHEVCVCHDGPAALSATPVFAPDAVVLDIGLPNGMDGYEVARRLRSEGLVSAFLVALTGYGQEDDRQRSREAGFDYHLTKPADPAEVAKLLRGVALQ